VLALRDGQMDDALPLIIQTPWYNRVATGQAELGLAVLSELHW